MSGERQSSLDWLWNPVSAFVVYLMVLFASAVALSYESFAARLAAFVYILLVAISLALTLKGGELRRLGGQVAFLSFFSSAVVYFALAVSGVIPNARELLTVVCAGYLGAIVVVGFSPIAGSRC